MKYSKCYAFIWFFSLVCLVVDFCTRDLISFILSLVGLICSQAFYREAIRDETKSAG